MSNAIPKSAKARSLMTAIAVFALGPTQAAVDFSGVWMPVAELATPWESAAVMLTPEARILHQQFDPQRRDSTLFCMPLGTPRNMLNTAPYAIEILQREERITVIFDRLGDVRRIFLDERAHPADPVPTWMGHSIARWQGKSLIVETTALTDQSILSDDGLPHTDQMQIIENFSLVKKHGQQLLQVTTELSDPRAFTKPLKVERYFRRTPHVEMSEGSGLCLLDQWRKRLEQVNRELAMENKQLKPGKAAEGAP
jgi:hypothetical protein